MGISMKIKIGNNLKMKDRIFLSHFLLPLLVVTIISVLFGCFSYYESGKNTLEYETTIVSNLDVEFSNKLDGLVKLSSQYSYSSWIKRLKYMQKNPELLYAKVTEVDYSDYAHTLALTELTDSLIDKIFVYFCDGQFGISSEGKIKWLEFVNVNGFESDNKDLLFGNILKQNNQRRIFHDCSILKNGRILEGFIFIQTIPLENYSNAHVNIIFFVSYEHLIQYLTSYTSNAGKNIYLTDGKQKIYYINEEGKVKISSQDLSAESFEGFKRSEHQRQYYSYYKKDNMDLGIYLLLSDEYVYKDFYFIKNLIIIVYLTFVILLVFVTKKMAEASYQPIRHILEILPENMKTRDKKYVNEYLMIEQALMEINSQKKKLIDQIYEENPLIERHVVLGLINREEVNQNEIQYYNVVRKYADYYCLIVKKQYKVDYYKKEIDRCLAEYTQVHSIDVEYMENIVFVVSCMNTGIISEIVEYIQNSLEELGYQDILMGISQCRDDIKNLRQAYEEAKTSISYCYFMPGSVCWFEQIIKRENNTEGFTVREESGEALKQAVKNKEVSAAMQIYREILQSNRDINLKQYRSGIELLNKELMNWYTASFSVTLTEAGALLLPSEFNKERDYLRGMENRIRKIFKIAISRESLLKHKKNQQIMNYINEHITDGNLSLNDVAEQMHYTSSYFGRFFKEQFGCGFQEYVAKRRIELAMQYLDIGKENIQDIALHVGFTSDVTFRRIFKNYTGMTPTQYESGKDS